MKTKNPVVGIILDGFGVRNEKDGNPFFVAHMPFYKSLLKNYPNTTIEASGTFVGLPEGQMGNSEVGHLNLGAGRVVYQDFMRINNAFMDGSFEKNKVFLSMLERTKQKGCALHLIGLVSDGGIHSHIDHLLKILDMAAKFELKKVFVHCITDGRDTSPTSGQSFVLEVEKKLNENNLGRVASVVGRFYAMDREKRWNRTKEAFDLFVYGQSKFKTNTSEKAFKMAYDRNVSDEYIPTFAISGYNGMKNGDEVFFFNFRPDRMRQITSAFATKDFKEFSRKNMPKVVCTAMCEYDKEQKNLPFLFGPLKINNALSKVLSKNGLKQLKIAETTKYAHITYYLNAGIEKPYKNEDRVLIESAFVDDFADFPQMRAEEIANAIIDNLEKKKYDAILVNFSNADMVGHTGNMQASAKALEVLDDCLSRVVACAKDCGATCVITADHGNIEDMRTSNGKATTHTTNPVPFIVTDKKLKIKKGEFGLDCFAPTILDILNVEKPAEMTGQSIIEK